MFLNSVIVVLREVLEAAILVSTLLVLAYNGGLHYRWAGYATLLSVVSVLAYTASLSGMMDALDGAGQEVVNASLQLAVYLLLVAIIGLFIAFPQGRKNGLLSVLMVLAVSFAIVRECAEIQIYVQAFAAVTEQGPAVWTGSFLGAGIGVSAGVLGYATLRALPPVLSRRACLVVLGFIGAGMVMQATMLLEQVDWLPYQPPVWDSSVLVSEQSFTGELLYAVLGYEATPGALQVALYFTCLALVAVAAFLGCKWRDSTHVEI